MHLVEIVNLTKGYYMKEPVEYGSGSYTISLITADDSVMSYMIRKHRKLSMIHIVLLVSRMSKPDWS